MILVSLVANSGSGFRTAIEESVDLLKFNFGPNLQNVIIKPDMCYFWDHSTGQTTNPNFVGDLIDFLRKRISPSLEVSIVAADTEVGLSKHLFKFLGYEKIARDKEVKLVNLSEDSHEEVKVNIANQPYTFLLPSTMKNADLFVNVPKMKLWPQTRISCALKNVSDLFPSKLTNHSLDETIVAANKIVRPNLCLVDGIMVRGKHTKKLGLVMSSIDPVSIDSAAARIVGLDPEKIYHVVLAEKEGIGTIKYKAVGESISHFAKLFPRKSVEDNFLSMVFGFGLAALNKLGRNTEFH